MCYSTCSRLSGMSTARHIRIKCHSIWVLLLNNIGGKAKDQIKMSQIGRQNLFIEFGLWILRGYYSYFCVHLKFSTIRDWHCGTVNKDTAGHVSTFVCSSCYIGSLSTQLPGKVAAKGPSVWTSTNYMGDLNRAPGYWLQLSPSWQLWPSGK